MPLWDALMWGGGLALATWGRLDFEWSRVDVGRLAVAAAIAIGLSTVCGVVSGLYLGTRRLASFEESLSVAMCSLVATVGLMAVVAAGPDPHLVPLGAALAGGAYQLIGALSLRYGRRLFAEAQDRRPRRGERRVLIFGAGDAGSAITKALQAADDSDLQPVALLDDDPGKALLRLHRLRVVGDRSDIPAAAAEYQAGTLLIAMPSAPQAERVAVAEIARDAGLAVKILPSARERLVDPRNVGMLL